MDEIRGTFACSRSTPVNIRTLAMLDSLMGRDRNVCGKEKRGDSSFKDEEVCKFYLLDYCPHELFPNTRSDLGPCPREHRSDLKEAFEKDPDHEYYKALYEQEFMRFLKKLVDQMESRIKRVQQRIDANNASTEVDKDTAEKIQTVNAQISELLKKQDEAGSKGEMEVAEKLNEEVALLQREVQRLKNPHADIATIRESQLRVCAVCGALQSAGDALCRYESHASGKQHRGFERIRASLAKLVETESTREAFLNKHPLHRGSTGGRDSYYSGSGNAEGRRGRSSSSVGRSGGVGGERGGDIDRRRKPQSTSSNAAHGRPGGGSSSSGGGGYNGRDDVDRNKGSDRGRDTRYFSRGRSDEGRRDDGRRDDGRRDDSRRDDGRRDDSRRDDGRRYGGEGGRLADRDERRQRRGYADHYDGSRGPGGNSSRDGRTGGYAGDGREDRSMRNTGSGGRYGGHDDAYYYSGQDYRDNSGGRGTWEQQRRAGGGGQIGRVDYYSRGDEYSSRGYGGGGAAGSSRRERDGYGRSERSGHDGYVDPRGRGSEGRAGKYGGGSGGGYDDRGDRRYYHDGGGSSSNSSNRDTYDERRSRGSYDGGSSGSNSGSTHLQGGRDDTHGSAESRGGRARRGGDDYENTVDDSYRRTERRNSRESEAEYERRRRERDDDETTGREAREDLHSSKRRRGGAYDDDETRKSRPESDGDEDGTAESGYNSRHRRDQAYDGVQWGRSKEGGRYAEARGASYCSREKRGSDAESTDIRQDGNTRRIHDEERPRGEPPKNGAVSRAECSDHRSNSQAPEENMQERSAIASGNVQDSRRSERRGYAFTKINSKEAPTTHRGPTAQFGDEAEDAVKTPPEGRSNGKSENVREKPLRSEESSGGT